MGDSSIEKKSRNFASSLIWYEKSVSEKWYQFSGTGFRYRFLVRVSLALVSREWPHKLELIAAVLFELSRKRRKCKLILVHAHTYTDGRTDGSTLYPPASPTGGRRDNDSYQWRSLRAVRHCCTPWLKHVSQSSVATHLRWGGIFSDRFIANFLPSLTVNEFWKSVNIWRSYAQEYSVSFFDSPCICVTTYWACCVMVSLRCRVWRNVSVVSVEHSKLGLEARRRCCLFGWAQTWLHCSELSCSWLLNTHVESLHDALLLARESTARSRYTLTNKRCLYKWLLPPVSIGLPACFRRVPPGVRSHLYWWL